MQFVPDKANLRSPSQHKERERHTKKEERVNGLSQRKERKGLLRPGMHGGQVFVGCGGILHVKVMAQNI